jgi:NTE family protein
MKYRKLVLGGSGTELFAYIGALKWFHDNFYKWTEIVGVSGGALIGGFIASGWTPQNIQDLILDLDFSKFQDNNLIPFMLPQSKYGYIQGNKITEFLKKHIPSKFDSLDIPLTVMVTNLTLMRSECVNNHRKDDWSVPDVLRASMSIPNLFMYQNHKGYVYVDGGLFNNYPVDYFSNSNDVIGIKAISDNNNNFTDNLFSFNERVINAMLQGQENKRKEDAQNADHIFIKTGDKNGFSLSKDKKVIKNIIDSGYLAVERYFNK